ncbi:MAG: nitrous oxide reductase accessory protein NosL [Pseudomonadota bacterium]
MRKIGRFFGGCRAVLLVMMCTLGSAAAEGPCLVQHPLQPPRAEFTGRCPNCGMTRAMWARTWYTFTDSHGPQQACSMHCLADRVVKSGERAEAVRVACYLTPETMIPAAEAFYVLGSSAAGTMSAQSKPAFAGQDRAERFAATCGGRVMRFADAFAVATAALPTENRMIAERRLKKGKIAEPVDNADSCLVCEMFPARYPRHRAQIRMGPAPPLHFCSTQCLFIYLSRMPVAEKGTVMVWVTDTPSGEWISGLVAFYVVGSEKLGPMGYEAFAFAERAAAESFAAEAGKGRVVGFEAVSPEMIGGGHP